MRFRSSKRGPPGLEPSEWAAQFCPVAEGAPGEVEFCRAAVEWCEERLGEEYADEQWRYSIMTYNIWIKDPDVAFEFKLRWC